MTVRCGTLWGWGVGHTGLMGAGPGEDVLTPRPIPGLPAVHSTACGASSAFAIDADGRIWSWGWDAFHHMLGRGAREGPVPWLATPLRRMGHQPAPGRLPGDGGVGLPAIVPGVEDAIQVACGDEDVYALDGAGRVYAWGAATALGGGRKAADRPRRIDGLSAIQALACDASSQHALALDDDGRVWSWGAGHDGELGQGTRSKVARPEQVDLPMRAVAIAASFASSWAVLEDGGLWFWGNGQIIELVERRSYLISTPRQLPGGRFVRLAAAGHACAAWTGDGRCHLFGLGWRELLGQEPAGTEGERAPRLDGTQGLAVGDRHGLGWAGDGQLTAFGVPAGGALGDGTDHEDTVEPLILPLPGPVLTAAAGCGASFAVVGA
ncbi:MAG: hypothetical protein KC933_11305 [Myxococcales bacterium]|nr:hypothetical protein [Myxococcales bacterium]